MSDYGGRLFPQHAAMLAASGIDPDRVRARGYVSVDTRTRLAELGITKAGRNVPGLLVPQLRADGSTWGHQYRPDNPRLRAGKAVKYETPRDQRNDLDVPPGVGPKLGDPAVTLWITEGVKKADAAAAAGLCCIALAGVWSWMGTNVNGGKTAVPGWRDVALNGRRVVLAFDSDVTRKRAVRRALDELADFLNGKGATVAYLHLPDDDAGKTGLDDYLAEHQVDELLRLVRPDPPQVRDEAAAPPPPPPQDPLSPPPAPVTVEECHDVFRRWLGDEYDLDVLDVVLCALAAERLDGDPLWLLVISGPGAAKTETVQACAGAGAIVESTVTGEAALLSGTPTQERAKDATGGLLRRLGGRGVLVIKDVTSIISMSRDRRAEVLAALREVYDGRWSRSIGASGGLTLTWSGRLVVIGAVTTAWDSAHAVVSAMGDRFVNVRLDSTTGRGAAFRRTMANTGDETTMRAELAATVGGVVAGLDRTADLTLTETETERLLPAADVVTLARTGVEYDYKGDVIGAHAPEMPTRFARQLQQIMRGGMALGMSRDRVLRLAIRAARDTMPPIRLAIVDDLAEHPHSTPAEIRREVNLPWRTVDRQCQALHMLGVIACDEVEQGEDRRSRWYYSLAEGIDPSALKVSPDLATPPPVPHRRDGIGDTPNTVEHHGPRGTPAKSGDISPQVSEPLAPVEQLFPLTIPTILTCPACGWPVDSHGHAANCESA